MVRHGMITVFLIRAWVTLMFMNVLKGQTVIPTSTLMSDTESLPPALEHKDSTRYPFIVSLQIRIREPPSVTFYSGGTLVSEADVISNCHNFLLRRKHYWDRGLVAVVGSSVFTGDAAAFPEHSQVRNVAFVTRHSKCTEGNSTASHYDVALLKLNKPVKLNEYVYPIAILGYDRNMVKEEFQKLIDQRAVCDVFRWGWDFFQLKKSEAHLAEITNGSKNKTRLINETEFPDLMDDVLFPSKKFYSFLSIAKMTILPPKECQKGLCKLAKRFCTEDIENRGNFCASPWNPSKYACMTAGGPLVCKGYLVGVLNYELCFMPGPAVLTGPESILDVMHRLNLSDQQDMILASAKKISATNTFIVLYALPVITHLSEWHRPQ